MLTALIFIITQISCQDGSCTATQTIETAKTPHVRLTINGSCGSGTIVGQTETEAYILTNAHVVGTTIGNTPTITYAGQTGTRQARGRITAAAYSNRTMVDWAIVTVQGLKAERTMPMLKTEPTNQPYETIGSPRCIWPQEKKPFNDPKTDTRGLITGTPNAIGGQSGSAIYNQPGTAIALVTWSINGRCAGQTTQMIYRIATSRSTSDAEDRIDGLQECNQPNRPKTDNIVANEVNRSIEDLPIWLDPTQPTPKPAPNCMDVSDKERELIEFLRKQAAETNAVERLDWARLIALVLEIVKLLQDARK